MTIGEATELFSYASWPPTPPNTDFTRFLREVTA